MGSKTGWILALALIITVVIAAYLFIVKPPTSPPIETIGKGFLDLKVVTVPLTEVIGIEPTAPGNAADDYQKAIQLYIPNAYDIRHIDGHHFDRLAASADPWSDPVLKVCKEIAAHVAAGAKKRQMEYTFTHSPKRLKFGYHQPHADHFYGLTVAVFQCYQMHRDRKEFALAEKYLKDLLILGTHLLNERALAHINWEGIEAQTRAVQRLQELYGLWAGAPKHRLPAIQRYEASLRLISANHRKKRSILWDKIPARDPVTQRPILCAGDVFNVAENDQDRAWRVQAIISLAAVKYLKVDHRGDLKEAKVLIKRFLRSKDPIVKAAAEAADRLTPKQFRFSGSDFSEEEEDI